MTWLGKRPRSQLHLSWIKLEKRGVVLKQREYVALGQFERRACRVARIPVSTFRYEQTGTEDGVATADSGDGAGPGANARSVNPARSTGPTIFVGGWALAQLWLFWVAPIIGGTVGGAL